jgi:hypothetical protein
MSVSVTVVSAANSLTIFQASLVGSFNDRFIDEVNGYLGQPVMAAVEGIVLGHGIAVKVSELTQGVSIGDPFGQFPIVPIFDAHQNEGAQHLAGGEPVASGLRFFQALIELKSDGFQKFRMLVDEVGNLFQHRIELNALAAEFQIGERGLRMGGSHADSLNALPDTRGPFSLVLMDISEPIRQNLSIMASRSQSIDERIQKIKQRIVALGDLRPGAISQQYNVCGNPTCRCKATPPIKHGPYYQLSFTWKGKSSTRFVRDEERLQLEKQLDNYHRLRELMDEWIGLAAERSDLRLHEQRQMAARTKTGLKSAISKQKSKSAR